MYSNNFQLAQRPRDFRIAIVTSRFNQNITSGLLHGCKRALVEYGIVDSNIQEYWVPGAVEIPFITQKIAQTKEFDAIICLGAVIRGDTAHFDYVCKYVTEGILKVNLDYQLPTLFGIIMTNTIEQAIARSGNNEQNKGREAALAAIEMLDLVATLPPTPSEGNLHPTYL